MRHYQWVLAIALAAGACVDGIDTPECDEPWAVYTDADGDGFGDDRTELLTCDPTEPGTRLAGDCDDSDAAVHPDAVEVCDGVDQDCDGAIDVGAVDAMILYVDADGDGFGGALTREACLGDPATSTSGDDCDDGDPMVSPKGVEVCDGIDQDCDGAIDEDAVDQRDWFADNDGDGFGVGPATRACDAPPGLPTDVDGDCNDADASIYPGAHEAPCDGVDANCDGRVPDGVSVVGGGWYAKVQPAVAAASSGGTVQICPGTYHESVNIEKDLTLQGVNGSAEDIVIKAPKGRRALHAKATTLTLRGITFSGGYDVYDGGNVTISGDETLIEDCVFSDGQSDYLGGGLAWSGTDRVGRSELTIRNSEFADNYADYEGGGLSAASWGPYAVLLEDVRFERNEAGYAGGGASLSSLDRTAKDAVEFELIRAEFIDNAAGYEGGGLAVGGWRLQSVTLTDSRFVNNFAEREGGGASIDGWSPTELVIDGSTFDGNRTKGSAGLGLAVGSWSDDIVDVNGSTFSNHSCSNEYGCSAISLGGWGGAELTMDSTDVVDNGGGLSIGGRGSSYSAVITGGSFTRNGFGLSVAGDIDLDAVDLGVGRTDNSDWDVRSPGAASWYDGVTTLACTSSVCSP